MNLKFTINSQEYDVKIEQAADSWIIAGVSGVDRVLGLRLLRGDIIELTVPRDRENIGRTVRIPFSRTATGTDFSFQGRTFSSAKTASVSRRERKQATGDLTAPMMGVLVELMVTEGQHVQAHDPLAVIEAMKVMATIEAPFAGTVAKVNFAKGAVVSLGDIVVAIDPSGPPAPRVIE